MSFSEFEEDINLSGIFPLASETEDLINYDEGSSSGTHSQVKKKKKRSYMKLKDRQSIHFNNVSNNTYKIKIPKIPSDDIRRKYPIMILNISNSLDASMMYSFFQRFTHSETVFWRQVFNPQNPTLEIERLGFYGPDEIFGYMFALALVSPDRVLRMKKCTITTRSDSYRTEIVLEGDGDATWPYETDPVKAGHFLLSLSHQTNQDLKRPNGTSELSIASRVERAMLENHLSLAKSPLKVKLRGKVTIVISNIYERQEIDEIFFSTYGLYESAETKQATASVLTHTVTADK